MDRWIGKVAVVTGASSGIGAAIAEALVREGLQVVALARREERLQALAVELKGAKGKLHARRCDVTKEEDILSAFEWVKGILGGVDVLVNNAGMIPSGGLTDSGTDVFRQVLDVNVLAVAICSREAIRSMRDRSVDGHIININSVAGHNIVQDGVGIYAASKYAITGMTETLRKELISAKSKIKVTSLSPGIVETELFEASGIPNMNEYILGNHPSLKPKDVSDAIVFVLGTPPHVQICELTIRPVGEAFC